VIDFKTIILELKEYKKELFLANIVALLAVIIATPVPLLIPLLIDEILLDKDGKLLPYIDTIFGGFEEAYFYMLVVLVLTLILRTLFFLFGIWQNFIFTNVSQKIVYKIRSDLLDHLKSLDLSEYEVFSGAKISSLMVVDLATIETFLSNSISKFIISILTVIGVGIVLLLIEWRLALLILFLHPVIIYFTTKLANRVAKIKQKENALTEVFSETLNETLEFYEHVKASHKIEHFIDKLKFKANKLKDTSSTFRFRSDASSKFSFLFFLSGFELFRVAGIAMVFYGDLSIGLMLAVFGYLWVIMTPIQEIINIQYSYFNAKAALSRVNELFLLKQEPRAKSHIDSLNGNIDVNNLKFNYKQRVVLDGINLQIRPREKIAIVGGSGSGKTTLVKILAGFFTQSSGEVIYDGMKNSDIGLDSVRKDSFLVLQTPQIFNETLRYNLTFGKEVDDDILKRAINIANLDEFVKIHKDGFDTLLGRDSVKLSGGERQRVSIARMVVKDPTLIFLDEATSALDSSTESKVFENLQKYLKDKTVIMIAHRINTIKSADRVYALEGGTLKRVDIEDFPTH
jgi:ATP-binding cassette subfamily C protein